MRCAVTDEKTLPALEAAHIRDYRDVEEHTISNGILFRADIHRLFDADYVRGHPDDHFEVSHRIKEEFDPLSRRIVVGACLDRANHA